MTVDGDNPLSSDNPELYEAVTKHCTPVTVEVSAFYGVPTDALTFTAAGG